jgi:hypothetical protein
MPPSEMLLSFINSYGPTRVFRISAFPSRILLFSPHGVTINEADQGGRVLVNGQALFEELAQWYVSKADSSPATIKCGRYAGQET